MPVAAKDLLPGHARAAPTTAEVVRMRAGVTTFRSLCWRGLDAVPAEVTTHAALEKLWLHNNELRRLPREMASLSGLRVLTLSHNRRLGDGCWAVIERLLRLETLEVGDCGLETVPHSIGGLTRLKKLDLNLNYLTELPAAALARLYNLEFLDLNDNRLAAIPVEALRALPRLAEVQAYNNEARLPPAGAEWKRLTAAYPRNGPGWEYVPATHFLTLMTVCILDENVRWLEEFLAYHVAVGFDHVYLYDNTGSAGCHCVDAAGDAYEASGDAYDRNKYGFAVEAYGAAAYEAVAARYPGRVTRVPWAPLDEHGDVTYGQNEALRDYVDRFGGDATWCCFTDLDEYVFSPSGRDLRADLRVAADDGVSCVRLNQKKFRDRFELPRHAAVTQCFDCLDYDFAQRAAPTSHKNIVFLSHYRGLKNVHEVYVDGDTRTAPPDEWRFNHYNANVSQLTWMTRKRLIGQPALDICGDDGMRRYAAAVAGIRQPIPAVPAKNPMPIKDHSR